MNFTTGGPVVDVASEDPSVDVPSAPPVEVSPLVAVESAELAPPSDPLVTVPVDVAPPLDGEPTSAVGDAVVPVAATPPVVPGDVVPAGDVVPPEVPEPLAVLSNVPPGEPVVAAPPEESEQPARAPSPNTVNSRNEYFMTPTPVGASPRENPIHRGGI